MPMTDRQLDRDIRRSLTRSLRRWIAFGGGPRRHPGAKRTYERSLPEGSYKIYPISSREARHLGYQLSFAPTEKLPYGYRTLGLYPSPEEAAFGAAEHYAELGR
jgi:hypothetical protein